MTGSFPGGLVGYLFWFEPSYASITAGLFLLIKQVECCVFFSGLFGFFCFC